MAENPMRPKMKAPRPSLFQFILPYIIILGLIIFLIFGLNGFARANVRDYTFVSLVDTLETINPNDVVQITVAQRETVIDISGSIIDNGVTYTFSEIVPNFYEGKIFTALERFDNKVIVNNAFQQSVLNQILIYILPLALILAVGLFVMSRMGGGNANNRAFEFGKSPVKNIQNSKVRFADVAGCDEEKAELVELVDYLKNPKKFSAMGARIPKGVILKGPPGTGKTLLAKAVAGEANVPFFSISGSDFVEMFVGVGASRVRDMFKKAMQNAPSILFIDEIDAVGRQRGAGLGGGHDEREQTLNQLLVEMDGFADNAGIIVIAATNRPDVLDPALLRPGRFDRAITVNLPDKKGREAILKVHSKNKKLHADVDFTQIASRTPGFSGADLENVLNEAAILAVRLNQDKIQLKDVDEAIDRVMGGPAKTTKVITPREKELIAYHETGHAIVGLKLANALKVQKVTIIPRGDAGGYVLMTPTDDRFLNTKGELLDRITGLLAGRMSEEVFFDDVTTGAHNDIEQATKITRMMVTELGMSSLGPIQFERQSGSVFLGRDYTSAQRNVSSEIAYAIDKEISKIIHDAMAKAKKIILDNRKEVELIAKTLLEKETLTNEEVVSLVTYGKLPQPGMKIEEQFIENGPKKRTTASVIKPAKVVKEKVNKTKSK
jgi:cell division protease FtsH